MSGVLTALLGSNPSGPQPAFELISTVTSTSGGVTFSSIPNTYTHLQLRATIRNNYSSTNMGASLTLGSDTGSNYSWHQLKGNGSSVTSSNTATTSSITGFTFPAGSATAGAFGVYILDILDYTNTSKYTTTRMLGGYHSGGTTYEVALTGGNWRNIATVNTLTITNIFGSFVTGTRFSLYGIKAA